MDPIRIYNYIYLRERGLQRRLRRCVDFPDNAPSAVVRGRSRKSGLRGRGGAGFHTGLKWELLAKATGDGDARKFLVCNADEGDPGSLHGPEYPRRQSHIAIIEGMIIAVPTGSSATEGVVYVRSEYPLAIKHADDRPEPVPASFGLLGSRISWELGFLLRH